MTTAPGEGDAGVNEQRLRGYLKRATADLRRANRRLREMELKELAPIAITSMSCRFPGNVVSPDDLWQLLIKGTDAVSQFPGDRGWDTAELYDPDPDRTGKTYVTEGAFVSDIDTFDADFYGISPREALAMDPQQRLLLEISWEAFERAGVIPATLRGTQTGVFIGINGQDYLNRLLGMRDQVEGHLLTGISASAASGRIAYSFGLEGPAVTIDTACSSALVAMHLACQALRQGECDLALAGGVTIMSTPGIFVVFSRMRGLAPDGRCKAFAADADGTGWGEGAGMILLERLSDARAKGHPVLAVIRGSAVNQDGASNGLSAPNGPSQERVIRAALTAAQLSPADIDAVEAHGTGTTLGDPIEAQALLNTYGTDPARLNPLWLGSVKSNIGHTQAAAGAAGIIKMVTAMQHGQLPRTLHVDAPTPHVDWDTGQIALLTEPRPWPDTGRPRRAAVSSFGISGTNAHLILEQSPHPEPAPADSDGRTATAVPWIISATTETSLRAYAKRLHSFVTARPDLDSADIGYSLATTRTQFSHRAVITAADGPGFLSSLDSLAQGQQVHDVSLGTVRDGKMAFLFTGQGAQRPGMGAGLYAAFPAFADALDQACQYLDPHLDQPLRTVMFASAGTPEAALLDHTRYTQPALFAYQSALFTLLTSLGLRPDRLTGHSIGEISAAHAAGVLTLPDACTLVTARARLMAALPPGGIMIAITATEDEAAAHLPPGAAIAAVNGPAAIVLSGDEQPVRAAAAHWAAQSRKTRELAVSHAFHSPRIDPITDALTQAAAALTYHRPQIPLISAVTGRTADPADLTDPAYWARQARATVRFADTITTLATSHVTTYLEIGPHPTLTALAADILPDTTAALIPAQRDKHNQPATLLTALAHIPGTDWNAALNGKRLKRVQLPTYTFAKTRYWPNGPSKPGDLPAAGLSDAAHPLLAAAATLPDGSVLLTGRISADTAAWLPDHAVHGTIIMPGTALADLALHAAARAGTPRLAELTLQAPLALPPDGGTLRLQVTAGPPGPGGHRPLAIHTQPASTGPDSDTGPPWTCHATGTATPRDDQAQELDLDWATGTWPPPGTEPVSLDGLYDQLAAAGLDYGPAFRGLTAAWCDNGHLYAEAVLPDGTDPGGHKIHPALLDAALHAAALSARADGPVRLPFSYTGLDIYPGAGSATALRAQLVPGPDGTVALAAVTADGAPAAAITTLATRPVTAAQFACPARASLYELSWTSLPDSPAVLPAPIAITGTSPAARALAEAAIAAGTPVAAFPGLDALDAALDAGGPVPGLVLAGPLGTEAQTAPPAAAATAVRAALEFVQEYLASPRLASVPLAWITAGAAGPGPVTDLPAAAAAGLIGSAQAEHPGRITHLDLDPRTTGPDPLAPTATLAATLTTALAAVLAADEPRAAVRDGVVLVPRLARPAPPSLPVPRGTGWRLSVTEPGTLENLAIVPAADPGLPGPGEVRLAVQVAGLNFRDVLIALGMYPGQAPLGAEAAGVVTAAGPGVTAFRPGDRVMGLAAGAAAPQVVTDARLLAPVPPGWTWAEAAAAPVAFLTACYALTDLAGLRPGRKILIHAATGGVGMAAVQLARLAGADIYATASPAKQHLLRAAGIPPGHIASTRTLDFETAIRAATGGTGPDIILHSLAGEFTDASLRLLAPGGKLIDMGKTDIRDPAQVSADHPGITYQAFDTAEAGPDRIAAMLTRLTALFTAGELRPLPVTATPLTQARDAFRTLSQARHTGKLALTIPRAPDPDGTVLITGGTGTLGAITARHLAATGQARHLLLLSRRGPQAPGAEELAADLEAAGTRTVITACDVTSRPALAKALAAIPPDHPLTAVIHTAGTTSDATITTMTTDQIDPVLAPKATAAWHLHQLTAHLPLTAFVLYSSAAGQLGNPGQGNYAAANTFLDALATWRHHHGHPATSLAWGQWAQDSAITSALTHQDRARITRNGITPMPTPTALAAYDTALTTTHPLLIPATFSTTALRRLMGGPSRVENEARSAGGQLPTGLSRKPEAEQLRIFLELVQNNVAAVTGHETGRAFDSDRTFQELGFDSLTAVEFRNRLTTATGLRLPATLTFDHPTATALSLHLVALMRENSDPAESSAFVPAATGAIGTNEPIAVVGMGCRFPGGAGSPAEFWELVDQNRDAITAFPAGRDWDSAALYHSDPDHPGTSYTRHGGFLHDADQFDAAFFGITPREAHAIDPQQRILLETAWEALERARITPATLRGTRTGVYVGMADQHYGTGTGGRIPAGAEGYLITGTSSSIASGRIAYTLGLEGPAVTIDTACSSSLVAIHLAVQALRNGECDLALAGGVAVMATPGAFTEFSRQRGLAPDGRCKSFAAAADGVAWGEGAGIVLLGRLSDARASGHPVLAVIRASAVNQDGASNGLTAPNGPAQERVIRAALAAARLSPADVDAVEAHGTGTTLGDPIEANALLNTYGADPARVNPLWLGSVKSNIGHTQAAAGVAGVIKMITAMQHGRLPRTLHVDAPTPHVDWDAGQIALLTDPQPWPDTGRPRRAAVSSFGISGTNAHLILEQAPEPAPARKDEDTIPGDSLVLWPLSGRTPQAVQDAAARLDRWLDDRPDTGPAAIGYSLATTRTQFEHRAVLAGTGQKVRAGLAALAAGQQHPAVITGSVPAGGARPVLVFPGQGSQWPGMTADLLVSSPVFAARIGECADALAPRTGWDLHAILTADPDGPAPGGLDLDSPAVIQPVLWAVMTGLAALWAHHGIEPAAVAGHSQGEIAAATVAGILSLDEAAALVAARSAVITALAPPGAMASLAAGQDQTAALIAGYQGQLAIATINSPGHTVISGHPDAIDDLLARAAADGITARKLPVSYASHHPALDAIRGQILAALPPLTPRPAQVPFYSAVTGALADPATLDAAYWYDNLRQPVRFGQVITAALAAGHRLFLEASPHPVLIPAITAVIDATGLPAAAAGTLRRHQPGPAQLITALATANAHGAAPDWHTLFPAGTSAVPLPTYPFQHQPYWLHTPAGPGDLPAAGLTDAGHPLLAAAAELPDGTLLLTGRITTTTAPWLADHTVLGTVIVPGTALASLALHAATLAGTPHLAELTLHTPLTLPGDSAALRLHVTAGPPAPGGHRTLAIHTQPASTGPDSTGPDSTGDPSWTCHATGTATPAPDHDQDWDWAGTWPPPAATPVSLDGLYEQLAATGLDYGSAFRGLTAAWQHGTDWYAEAALPDGTDPGGYQIHPALLDAALHAAALTAPAGTPVRLPFSFTGLDIHPAPAPVTTLRARLTVSPDATLTLHAVTTDGTPAAVITALAVRPVTAAQLTGPARASLHELSWLTVPAEPAPLPGPVALVGASPAARALAQAVQAAGTPVTAYPAPGQLLTALDAGDPVPGLILAGPPAAVARTAPPAAAATAVADTLAFLQEYLAAPRLAGTRLAWITAGAAGPGPATDLAAAATAGLIRSAQSEHPARITHLDIDPDPGKPGTSPGSGAAALATALAAGEPHAAIRGTTLLAPRLTRTTAPAPTQDPGGTALDRHDTALDRDGTVLITGGTGTLGAIIARHLAVTGQARHFLLLSRRGPAAPGAPQLAEDLAAAGAETVITACDVSSRRALAKALAAVPAGHPLTAVIHTAGTTSDATITTMDPGQVGPVLAPKADAAWHLHQLTKDTPLAAFVLFSSAAGQLGSPGQGNYAAANTFLDALASWRQARGLPAVSLAWGLWAQDSGITATLAGQDRARLGRNGIIPMPTQAALAAFDAAMDAAQVVLIPATFSTAALRGQADAGVLPPLLRGIAAGPAGRQQSAGPSLAERLAGRDESEQRRLVLDAVRESIAAVLGYDSPALIDAERAFQDMGFDSLTAIELRNRLTGLTGLRLPAVLVFDHPSATALAEYLRDRLGPADPDGRSAILADLDRLEAALSALAPEEMDDPAVKGRLRALTAKWTGNGRLPDADVDGQLQNASAEEVLDFIDRELRGT